MGVPRAALLAVVVLLTAVFIARDAGLMARPDPSLSRPGQRVIVCGASKGIGRDLALLHAKRGDELFLTARGEDALRSIASAARQSGAKAVHILPGDLGDQQHAKAVIETAAKSMGGIDILYLNHVVGYWGRWLERDAEDMGPYLKNLFAINTFSYIYLATYAVPHLSASRGAVSVVSSGAGQQGLPKVSPYAATKHALHGFFNSLRHEMAALHPQVSITISVLGSIDTESNVAATKDDLANIKRYPSVEAAQTIIDATLARSRTVYYPYLEMRVSHVLWTLWPEAIDFAVRTVVPA